MITIISLWLPILLSAIVVWIASAIVWMALPHHKSDYRGLPDEEAARTAMKTQDLPPGQYDIPHLPSRSSLKQPEYQKKFEEGPVGFLTVLPKGIPGMGKSMVLSLVYYLVISIFAAYLASRTLAPGAEYLSVFRLTGTVAWLAYGFAIFPDVIWFGRPWSFAFKNLFDALFYALLTAGMFGALWP
jgi:hypothetical protein